MATVVTSAPAFIPTPEQIAAELDAIHARRLAQWDENHPTEEDASELRQRSRKRREQLKAE